MSQKVMADMESLNVAKTALRVSLITNKEISRDVLKGGLRGACENKEFGDVFCDVIAEELASNIKSYKSVQLGEKVEIGLVDIPMKVANRVSKILQGCQTSW